MERVEAHITVDCINEHQHKVISTLLKTILHALDLSVESGPHKGNEFKFTITNAHQDAVTEYVGTGREANPLKKAFGL